MDIYVLDQTLTPIAVIDAYESLIWTTRYYTPGDFELYLPVDNNLLSILKIGNYLRRFDNDRIMIIEKIEITTDVENGNYLIVTGRSAESILARRIVWAQTNLNGKAEQGIRRLISENVISPDIAARKISNFKLGSLQNYSETISLQTTGDLLSEIVNQICTANKWGWKVTLDEDKNFVFDLYKGIDNGVIFSPEFDNLINSNYQYDNSESANVALVAGEGEGIARRTQIVGSAEGIDRREIYVDARDVSSNDSEISESQYNELLAQRGDEKLNETASKESFESEVEYNTTYHYKTDYNIGDVVTVENEYGITAKSRIIEIIENDDTSGYKVIPTFEDWSV